MGKDQKRFLSPHLDLHLEVFVPKKKEIAAAGGWGESQNTFSCTGWMTGRMDGKSFTTTTSFTICN
jgi:hypothetical protein